MQHAAWADQREFLCYKSDVAHLATLVECSNKLSALAVRHPDVALPSVLTTR